MSVFLGDPTVLFQALALFVPILAANQAGQVAHTLDVPNPPTCPALFGENKTVAPFVLGPILSMAVLLLYFDPHWFKEGLLFGLSAVAADHIKSAIKHSPWVGKKPGDPWFLDRIDFAIGGALAAKWYFAWVTWEHVLWIVAVAYPVHLIGNQVGYLLGWRKTPH